MDLAQVPLGDREHALHHQRGPCVGHVLDGQAVADPLPRVGGELALQHADQPEHRVPAAARLLAHRLEVERVRGVRGDLARRGLGDQPELALGRRQLADDAQPGPRAAVVTQQLRASPRSPTGGRRRPSRRGRSWRRDAGEPAQRLPHLLQRRPPGHDHRRPDLLDSALEQAALDQRAAAGGRRRRAGRSRPVRAARPRTGRRGSAASARSRPASRPRPAAGLRRGSRRARRRRARSSGTGTGSAQPDGRRRAGAGRSARTRARRAAGPRRSRGPRAPSPAASAAPAGRPRRRGRATGAGSTMKLTCSKRPCTTYTRAERPEPSAARAICVALPVSTDGSTTNATSSGGGEHVHVADADEHAAVVGLALDLHDRVLGARGGHDELGAPVDPPAWRATRAARPSRARRPPARSRRGTAAR